MTALDTDTLTSPPAEFEDPAVAAPAADGVSPGRDPRSIECRPRCWRVHTPCCRLPLDLARDRCDLQLTQTLTCPCGRGLRLAVGGDARQGWRAYWTVDAHAAAEAVRTQPCDCCFKVKAIVEFPQIRSGSGWTRLRGQTCTDCMTRGLGGL